METVQHKVCAERTSGTTRNSTWNIRRIIRTEKLAGKEKFHYGSRTLLASKPEKAAGAERTKFCPRIVSGPRRPLEEHKREQRSRESLVHQRDSSAKRLAYSVETA